MSILELKNIRKSFDNKVVLDGIDLTVDQGEVVSILGPSGSGKYYSFEMCHLPGDSRWREYCLQGPGSSKNG